MTSELLTLAAKCEAASGACMGTDADIELAIGNWPPEHYEAWSRFQECGEAANPPFAQPVGPNRYTGSLDAAMMLIPSSAMRRSGDSAMGLFGTFFCDIVQEDGCDFHALANNEPCAIVAAALRARAHTTQEES
jgi:hypothetical protein